MKLPNINGFLVLCEIMISLCLLLLIPTIFVLILNKDWVNLIFAIWIFYLLCVNFKETFYNEIILYNDKVLNYEYYRKFYRGELTYDEKPYSTQKIKNYYSKYSGFFSYSKEKEEKEVAKLCKVSNTIVKFKK